MDNTRRCRNCQGWFSQHESEHKGFCCEDCKLEYVPVQDEITEEEVSLGKEKWEGVTDGYIRSKIKKLRRDYRISFREYCEITKECGVCGFTETVDVHHIISKRDGGKDEPKNYMGLCPNCHHTLHKKNKTLGYLKEKYQSVYK